MISKLIAGGCLMAACVAIHVAGLTAALRWFHRDPDSFWGWTRLFTGIAGCTIFLHLLDTRAWAVYYRLAVAIPT